MIRTLAAFVFALSCTSTAFAADPRCAGLPRAAAARFSKKALPGKSDADRYDAYLTACALDRVVALTTRLVALPTVSSEAPAGKSPAIAAEGKLLARFAKDQGFRFRTLGADDVFELAFGQGPATLGLVLHGDVVPAPAHEWKRAPFEAKVVDGRLYGRGSEDDKGPLAAVLTCLAMAKELGLAPRGSVLAIIGTGEESEWAGMTAYAKNQPKPTHVVSVDGNYPVVVAQSGFVAWGLEAPLGQVAAPASGKLLAIDVTGGEFLTQVPGTATLTLLGGNGALQKTQQAIAGLRASRKDLAAEVGTQGGNVVVTAHGTAVHSSVADSGHNALWDLGAIGALLPLEKNGIEAVLTAIATGFDGDHLGEKLGLSYEDPLMGKLLVVPTVLRVKDGNVVLQVNMRRPRGKDGAAFRDSLKKAAAGLAQRSGGRLRESADAYVGDPAVADTSGRLVATLLEIYRRHQGVSDAQPISVRGGTYARLFPGGVDFGPSFPGEVIAAHAPDESISLEKLEAVTEMTGKVIYALAVEARP